MIGKDLRQLFLAHRRELQAYLMERVRDRDVAADLTQETFLRFAEQGTDVVLHDRSYLYRTAQNLAIDHVRRSSKRRTDATSHDDLAAMPDEGPGPEDVADARQRLTRLRNAVAAMPERTRTIFILNRMDGLSYGQVASRLGVSESTVQKHLAKALLLVMNRVGS